VGHRFTRNVVDGKHVIDVRTFVFIRWNEPVLVRFESDSVEVPRIGHARPALSDEHRIRLDSLADVSAFRMTETPRSVERYSTASSP
jgi:hypothetical protein